MFFDDGYFREETREGFVIAEDMKRAWAAQLEVLEEVKRCLLYTSPSPRD